MALLADATGSTLYPALASTTLADYGDQNMVVILRGLETTTHAPYLAGWHLRIVPDLGQLPLRMITPGTVDRVVHGWIADGCGRSTVKNTIAMLARTLDQAVRDGTLDRNPARITGWQHEYRIAEDELDDPRALALRDWTALTELSDALVNASHDHYPGWGEFVIFNACTAARIGEVSGVRACDIDPDTWIWTLLRQTTPAPGGLVDKHTKGRRARKIPIIEPLRPLVARRLQAISGDPHARLFTGPRGGRISTAVLRDATHWDEVVVELGYEHLRRHDLRHTGLTWMADAGIPLHVLQLIAGHRQITTTQRYLHPDLRHLTRAGTTLTRHLTTGHDATHPHIPARW
ncbi:integrase [Streptomyces albus subsp. albus]|nr:integrase [Streptomyces albus subsp. albus]